MKKIIKFSLTFIVSILVAYSVIFSFVGTLALIYGYRLVTRPLNEVKVLINKNPEATIYMRDRIKTLKTSGKADSLFHTYVSFDSISPALKNAVVASEDDGFYLHPGFDINAIAAAFERNLEKNKLTYGGSTITQQLAKNLFLSGDKTFTRKLKELLYTVLLEKYLTKDRILELYLNYAQWGENIFGCEAASQHYFKKPCSQLTIWESARMAATLAKPATITPHYTKSKFMWKRLRVIADNMYKRKRLSDSGYTVLTGIEPPQRKVNWQDTITIPVDTSAEDTSASKKARHTF